MCRLIFVMLRPPAKLLELYLLFSNFCEAASFSGKLQGLLLTECSKIQQLQHVFRISLIMYLRCQKIIYNVMLISYFTSFKKLRENMASEPINN